MSTDHHDSDEAASRTPWSALLAVVHSPTTDGRVLTRHPRPVRWPVPLVQITTDGHRKIVGEGSTLYTAHNMVIATGWCSLPGGAGTPVLQTGFAFECGPDEHLAPGNDPGRVYIGECRVEMVCLYPGERGRGAHPYNRLSLGDKHEWDGTVRGERHHLRALRVGVGTGDDAPVLVEEDTPYLSQDVHLVSLYAHYLIALAVAAGGDPQALLAHPGEADFNPYVLSRGQHGSWRARRRGRLSPGANRGAHAETLERVLAAVEDAEGRAPLWRQYKQEGVGASLG